MHNESFNTEQTQLLNVNLYKLIRCTPKKTSLKIIASKTTIVLPWVPEGTIVSVFDHKYSTIRRSV
jgi:hypothetical protein